MSLGGGRSLQQRPRPGETAGSCFRCAAAAAGVQGSRGDQEGLRWCTLLSAVCVCVCHTLSCCVPAGRSGCGNGSRRRCVCSVSTAAWQIPTQQRTLQPVRLAVVHMVQRMQPQGLATAAAAAAMPLWPPQGTRTAPTAHMPKHGPVMRCCVCLFLCCFCPLPSLPAGQAGPAGEDSQV